MRSQTCPPLNSPQVPNWGQSITYNPTTATNNLQPPICQSTPEANCLTSAQSSSKLDTDQGDMIVKTIKQVRHKLHQTIVTSDIDNFDLNRATSAIPNKPITTPSIAVNNRQDRATTLHFPKTPSLQPTSSDQGNHIACNMIN